jgi:tRNA (guanine37-N1)-methyltransferase
VYANDLNPSSAQYLAANAALNRLAGGINVFNMDGRAFIRLLCATPGGPADDLEGYRSTLEQQQQQQQQQGSEQGQQASQSGTAAQAPGKKRSLPVVKPIPASFKVTPGGLRFHHAVMNLPASAIEFLDAYRGAFDPATWADTPLPMVHVYTFKPPAETEAGKLQTKHVLP